MLRCMFISSSFWTSKLTSTRSLKRSDEAATRVVRRLLLLLIKGIIRLSDK